MTKTDTCGRCGQTKPGGPVMFPNQGIVESVYTCFDCLGEVRDAARRLRTGMEISGPTLEQAIIGDVQRMAAGQKDPNLVGRPFVNHTNTALAKLVRRGAITPVQYLAGDKYLSIWLRSGLNSRVSSAYGGGSGGGECTYGMAATEVVAHNRRLLREARAAIDKALTAVEAGKAKTRMQQQSGVAVSIVTPHEWFEMLAVADCSRIEVGHKVAAGRKISRASASKTGVKVINKCLDTLIKHFHIEAPDHYRGNMKPLHGEVSEEAKEFAKRYDAEQQAKIAGEGDE